jgi:hypothetical protein
MATKSKKLDANDLDDIIMDEGIEDSLNSYSPTRIADEDLAHAWRSARDAVKKVRELISEQWDEQKALS